MTKSKNKKKANNQEWFIKVRGSYLPNSPIGALTYIPYVFYLLLPLIFVLNHHYDLWLSLILVIPNWVAAVAVMNWVAARHC